MMVSNPSEAAQPTAEFSLPRRLDVLAANPLRDWFLTLKTDAVMDASGVEVVTTAGLQVMMAGRDWMQSQNFSLQIVSPSNGFRDCIAILGTNISRLTTSLPTEEPA